MQFNDGTNSASASDWALERLYQGILAQELLPETRLTEAALSEWAEVSRTPLRDALQRLEMAGIVSRQRNRSIRINPLSMDEMERLSMLREVLEGLLVRRVAMRNKRGEVSLSRLEAIAEEMSAVDRGKGIDLLLRLGLEFHRELSRLAGDPMASRMVEQVLLSFERYRHLLDRPDDRSVEILLEHKAIIDAIRAGDESAAERLMHEHLSNARTVYAKRLSTGADIHLKRGPRKTP